MQPLNPEMAQQIAEEILAGAKLYHTAQKHGISPEAVYSILTERDIDYTQLLDERRIENESDYYKKRYAYLRNLYPANYAPPSRETLIDELCAIAIKMGRLPKIQELRMQTKFGYNKYRLAFGRLKNALRDEYFIECYKAILEEKTIRDQQILHDYIKKKTELLGYPPGKDQLQHDRVYKLKQYRKANSELKQVMTMAGIHASEAKETRKRHLLEFLKQRTEELGYPPDVKDLANHPVYSYADYYHTFGGLKKAFELAGIDQREVKKAHKKKLLLEYLKQKTAECGYPPERKDLVNDPVFSYTDYYLAFGSFKEALKQASVQSVGKKEAHKKRLLEFLKQQTAEQGYPPTKLDLLHHPVYGYMKYFRAFGGLKEALQQAGLRQP